MLLLLTGFAAWRITSFPVDVFPELNAPTVVILTEAGGLAADEVEQYVTLPIESAVNGLRGVRRVRSTSAIGLSLVWAEFGWSEDIHRARQFVSERLSAVRDRLPPGARAEMTPITSITGEIMLLALSAPDGTVSGLELRSLAEFELRTRLLGIPGVAQVIAIGGELPEYQVNVRQDDLRLYDLSVEDVVRAAEGAHSTFPAGYLADVDRQELPIRQQAAVRSVEHIRSTIVTHRHGAPVRIGDVADVLFGPAPRRGAAADSGHPAVVLSIQKSPGVNTLSLTGEIDRILDAAEPSLGEGIRLNRRVFRQADFIERSVRNVSTVLIEASIVVALVVILFLLNLRTTFITLTALPISLAVSLLLLSLWDITINVMTLGGLAVAIGELVDDAIIDVENVYRRLRENRALPPDRRRGVAEVVFAASNEIRSSVVFATVIIVLVFVPLLFLRGLEGRFFRPLGIAYITSILASLIVALTVTPALCKWLLGWRIGGRHGDGPLARLARAIYAPMLGMALRWRWAVLGGAGAAMAGSLWLAGTFGSSFLPSFNEGTFTVFLMAPPGTSLAESDRLAGGIERRIAEITGVRSVTRRTGRAERDEHAEPVSNSEIEVTMDPGRDPGEIRARIDAVLADVPGITTSLGQPIEHRLSHILSGTPAAIAINVFGEDLDRLRALAREIEAALRAIPGARDVAAHREVLVTGVPIRYRPEDLAAAGLTPAGAAEQVRDALYGDKVAEVNQGLRRYDLVVRVAPGERETLRQVSELVLQGASGAHVRLRDVADVVVEKAPNLIAREGARRKAVISCNVEDGWNLGHLVAEVQKRVDPIVRRGGCDVVYGGQFEAQQSASRSILLMGAGVGLIVFLCLHMALGSTRAALLVMLNLPLALIGGIAAIFVTGSESVTGNIAALAGWGGRYEAPVISIAGMVGFVTLFGIAVRNGILLVNHYTHLRKEEGVGVDEAIRRGSLERLVPILMTALCAIMGLLPIAIAGDRPGSELLAPLSVVVLGGLVSSTILNLFVVPAGYALVFGRRRRSTTT